MGIEFFSIVLPETAHVQINLKTELALDNSF